ncbi:MAG: DUF2851 family protein [Bacteroidetes bacterium]|nr:DUF2851 family protein [Bacteroidota bacterium]MCW5895786.1 DUF2851 family protein [Bacteroidota bacterium]
MNFPDMPESILRRIWQEQSFTKDHLTTKDGKPVRIISPGVPNTDGGPDFLNAKISIGTVTFHGDVELHINAGEWLSHKHDSDPHYNRVILHVVMSADPLSPPTRTASKRAIPLLVLHPYLDEKCHGAWEKSLLDDMPHTGTSLPCTEINESVPRSTIVNWVEKLGRERMELKVRRFEERLKQLVDESKLIVREPYPRYYGNPDDIPPPRKEYGKKDFTERTVWEQLLYEGIMEALGYSKNTKPFLSLARAMQLHVLRRHTLSETQTMMALLFGAAGLLPSAKEVSDAASRRYVASLKRQWKQLRPEFKDSILNEADWLFFRLRPGNFPTARLAAMCFLLPQLFGEGSFRTIIGTFKSDAYTPKKRNEKLHALFDCTVDEFWHKHYHFKGRSKETTAGDIQTSDAARTTLGAARIHDIIVNVLIPVVLLYARIFNDSAMRKNARSLLAYLTPSQENSVVEVVRNQLTRSRDSLRSSLHQQGAIHLFRYYCSEARCSECAVGRVIGMPLLSGKSL